MVILRPWSCGEADDVRPDPERLLPVLVLVLRAVGAHERVDERDVHRLGGGDDVLEVADDLGPMVGIGVERVRVVAETRDGQALRRDLVDDLGRLARRQVRDVDVGGAGVATGRARWSAASRRSRCSRSRSAAVQSTTSVSGVSGNGRGQQAESHRVAPPCAGRCRPATGSRTTSTQRPVRALSAIASLTSISSWPSAKVGIGGVGRPGRPPRRPRRPPGNGRRRCRRSPRRGRPGRAAAARPAGPISAGFLIRISFGRSRWPIQIWSGCSESQATDERRAVDLVLERVLPAGADLGDADRAAGAVLEAQQDRRGVLGRDVAGRRSRWRRRSRTSRPGRSARGGSR